MVKHVVDMSIFIGTVCAVISLVAQLVIRFCAFHVSHNPRHVVLGYRIYAVGLYLWYCFYLASMDLSERQWSIYGFLLSVALLALGGAIWENLQMAFNSNFRLPLVSDNNP